MILSKRLSTFSLAIGILLLGMVAATPAQAATATPAALTMNFQCAVWTNNSSISITVTGAVGDTFSAVEGTGGSGCAFQSFTVNGASSIVTPSSGNIGAFGSPTTFAIVGPGTFTVVGAFDTLTVIVSVAAPVTSGSTSGPPDVHQSFALGAGGNCSSVSRPSLDWSGVASGNWTQSWAMWPNAGTGGPVCNRVLWYDLNTSRWNSPTR